MSGKILTWMTGAIVAATSGCGGSDGEPAEYDDSAERAALIEGRGFQFTGFVPVEQAGVDGKVEIRPRAVTVAGGVVGAIVEYAIQTQQDKIYPVHAGFFDNGFVGGHEIGVFGPSNISPGTSIEDERILYGFHGVTSFGIYSATLRPSTGPVPYVAHRPSNGGYQIIDIDRSHESIFVQPHVSGVAYGYRGSAGVLGVALPTGAGHTLVETTTDPGDTVALDHGDGTWLAAVVTPVGEPATLEIYRLDGMALTRVVRAPLPSGFEEAGLRLLHAAAETYVIGNLEPPRVLRVDGTTLAELTVPVGTRHTFAVDPQGALYVGFSDPSVEGRATVARSMGGAFTTVGQPGFSRDAVTAHVFPIGPDVYVAFSSLQDAIGAAIACTGTSCVPYRKKVLDTPTAPDGTVSCDFDTGSCKEARGFDATSAKEFQEWCMTQRGRHMGSACDASPLGGCKELRPDGELLTWFYEASGATAEMIQSTCNALGQEYVPPS